MNDTLERLLSEKGKKMDYITDGILGQSAEARKSCEGFNATLGEARFGGAALYNPLFYQGLEAYRPEELFPYSNPFGEPGLRKKWKEKILTENPSLDGEKLSLPVVTCGLTHGLWLLAQLFVDPGDPVLLPSVHWENYDTIFDVFSQGRIVPYPIFDDQLRFTAEGLARALREQTGNKAVVLLNFPSNPAGYMPSDQEMDALAEVLLSAARDEGKRIMVIADDAYFGFHYKDTCSKESVFSRLAGREENLLPVKVDGATKGEFAGGLRIGFFSAGATDAEVNGLIESKLAALIRCTVSSSSKPAQSIILRALNSADYWKTKAKLQDMIGEKAKKVLKIIENCHMEEDLVFYPFNSGYFVCFRLLRKSAWELRKILLKKHGIGVIAFTDQDVRVSFTAVEADQIEYMFETIFRAVRQEL